jgi:hypothetical protein
MDINSKKCSRFGQQFFLLTMLKYIKIIPYMFIASNKTIKYNTIKIFTAYYKLHDLHLRTMG